MLYAHNSSSDTQAEVTAFLHEELSKVFPTSGIAAFTRTFVGQCNVYLRYTNAAKREDCSNSIWENDPAYMTFCFYADDNGFYIEKPITHARVLKNAGVRYTKIKGATEMDCAVKLVEFLKKNSAEFLKLGLR